MVWRGIRKKYTNLKKTHILIVMPGSDRASYIIVYDVLFKIAGRGRQ